MLTYDLINTKKEFLMLSIIIFDLRPHNCHTLSCDLHTKTSDLFQDFEKNKICLKQFSGNTNTLSSYLESFSMQKNHLLFVSDLAEHLLIAKNSGFFCVGYDDGSDFLPVDYCFQDFSSVDVSYFKKILCRYQKEPISILTTRRLQIRELSPKDLPYLYCIYQEPQVSAFLPEGKDDYTTFYEKRCSYIDKIYPFYDFGMWGIFSKDTNTLIGECGLQPISIDGKEEIAIGYVLSSKFHRNGIGSEMVRATLRYAYREFGFSRIVAQIHPNNSASIALAKNCGFHYERTCADGTTVLFVYEHATQKELQNQKKATDITQKIYDSYQKNPDTTVYGKRYHT